MRPYPLRKGITREEFHRLVTDLYYRLAAKGLNPASHLAVEGMIELVRKFIRDEEGQDLVEYALLLVFLALAAISILPTLGSSVNRVFSQSNSSLNAS